MASDLYAVLNIDSSADPEAIRLAYRRLAFRHHPDMGGSAERMAELNVAWSILSNPRRRSAYDRLRTQARERAAERAAARSGTRTAGAGTASRPTAGATATTTAPRPGPASATATATPGGLSGRKRATLTDNSTRTLLDFGRFEGYSLDELARTEPDYLLWLARVPIGRRYSREIYALLEAASNQSTAAHKPLPRPRRRFGR